MARLRGSTHAGVHQLLGDAALDWQKASLPTSLKRYGFRHGVAHLLHNHRLERAAWMLTQFEYCVSRLDSEGTSGARPLAEDLRATVHEVDPREAEELAIWEAFFRQRAHLLERNHLDDLPVYTLYWTLGEDSCSH